MSRQQDSPSEPVGFSVLLDGDDSAYILYLADASAKHRLHISVRLHPDLWEKVFLCVETGVAVGNCRQLA